MKEILQFGLALGNGQTKFIINIVLCEVPPWIISGMNYFRKSVDIWGNIPGWIISGNQWIFGGTNRTITVFYTRPILRGFNDLLILEWSHGYAQPLVYHIVGMTHLPKKMGDGSEPSMVDPPKETKKLRTKPAQKGNKKFEVPPNFFPKPIQGTCPVRLERHSTWRWTDSSPPCMYCQSAGPGSNRCPRRGLLNVIKHLYYDLHTSKPKTFWNTLKLYFVVFGAWKFNGIKKLGTAMPLWPDAPASGLSGAGGFHHTNPESYRGRSAPLMHLSLYRCRGWGTLHIPENRMSPGQSIIRENSRFKVPKHWVNWENIAFIFVLPWYPMGHKSHQM